MSDEEKLELAAQLKAELEAHDVDVPHQWGVPKMQEALAQLRSGTPASSLGKGRTTQRAKSHMDEERERKDREAIEERRRRVERAPTLQETEEQVQEGDPDKMVNVRITKKGQGRVQTGELVDGRPEFYAQDEIVEMSEESALANEAKGYVETQ